jgi:hypothetical protein
VSLRAAYQRDARSGTQNGLSRKLKHADLLKPKCERALQIARHSDRSVARVVVQQIRVTASQNSTPIADPSRH